MKFYDELTEEEVIVETTNCEYNETDLTITYGTKKYQLYNSKIKFLGTIIYIVGFIPYEGCYKKMEFQLCNNIGF
jgi:hypothetical protein